MPGVFAPEVLADPIGVVVDLIAERKPGLDRSTITRVVEEIAGGRVKRRRLAQALLDRPRVLDDGRSPAPRAVGDLLVALNKAGPSHISAPVCAECGKHLRTLQRRGDDWYCAVCGPVREPCGECGRIRLIHMRDRDGKPRCVACPPDGGRDPLELAVDVITAADAALSTDVAGAAVRSAAPRVRAPSSACLGVAGPARTAHRRRRRSTETVGPAPYRLPVRRRRARDSPPALPPLWSNHSPAQANRREVAVPQLHR